MIEFEFQKHWRDPTALAHVQIEAVGEKMIFIRAGQ